jgi:hypothetical protein
MTTNPRQQRRTAARNAAIVEAFRRGVTTSELARTHRVTTMRVSQILAAAGVRREEGGAYLQRHVYAAEPGAVRVLRLTPLAERIVEAVGARVGGSVPTVSAIVEYVVRKHGGELTGEEFRPLPEVRTRG